MRLILAIFALLILCNSYAQDQPVRMSVDLAVESGVMRPTWAWFGYDEPNYTTMKNGKKLLGELAALSSVPVYVRAHNLLTSGDGKAELKWGSTNVYTEDKKGKPIYYWAVLDSIIDTYVARGMRPLMEIGFMPEALSTHPQPYKHNWTADGQLWSGWGYPPKDYGKWEELVFQWVKHSIERYGIDEVKTWYWELWNEPDIKYWQGTFDEYCKLYDYSANAVKRACPPCRMGGPHTTNPNSPNAEKFLRGFLTHCATEKNYVTGKIGAPLDFIAFHAKGNPTLLDGHIRMNMSPELNAIATGFKTVASFEAFKNLPVVIGECDPEGCAACSMKKLPQNGYRNGTMYSSYTVASHARIRELAEQYSINLEGIVTWAFEFEGQKWFDGFRDLATNGVDKPVLNVFRMFGMMPSSQLRVVNNKSISASEIINLGVHSGLNDIGAIASRNSNSMSMLLWNYYDDDLPAEPSGIEITLTNIPAKRVLLSHYRIDGDHSNSYETWKKMGSPQQVSDEQYKVLEESGQLHLLASPEWKIPQQGKTILQFSLPRQGVSLIKLEW